MISMNRLPAERRIQLLGMMVEGMSIRSIVRLTGASKNTIIKLLADAGAACVEYQDRVLRDLPCKRVQMDEVWAFAYCKQKNVATAKSPPEGAGDVWTWVGLCVDTKLAVSWLVGSRDGEAAKAFVADLEGRLANRVQLTSDGHKAYLEAVENAFGANVDYAMLIKVFGDVPEAAKGRYSPAECIGISKQPIQGEPKREDISTSYVERQNLTMRMHMRRLTRLTNAFSKKIENHAHSVALNFIYYNFVRIHSSLRVTPAMAAGVTDRLWEIADVAALIEAREGPPKKRGPYKPRHRRSQ